MFTPLSLSFPAPSPSYTAGAVVVYHALHDIPVGLWGRQRHLALRSGRAAILLCWRPDPGAADCVHLLLPVVSVGQGG